MSAVMREPPHKPRTGMGLRRRAFEDHNEACFIVKDRNGRALAYVYYEEQGADPQPI
jgi:hypothetical protein